MKRLISTVLLFALLVAHSTLCAQQFYDDGSMILSKISKDKKYGYEPNHKTSIKVGTIANEYAYLESLRGPHGEAISYRRLSSCCEFKSKKAMLGMGLLDKWEIRYAGLPQPIIIYLNGYDYKDPQCPNGLTFKTAAEVEVPVVFPADKILKVTPCNADNLHAVKEALLQEKTGELPAPDTNPEFKGGTEALKNYFIENPLTDERTKELIFRVSIGFMIDCNGNAGNFRILTKGKGDAETFANQVLEVVNNMPQQWQPAVKDGQPVDSYQVLSFTVVGGQLDKVTYR